MRKIRNRKGFTLIELMIVVVIIGILAAIAIPKFNQASARAKEKEADGILKQFYTLQNAYFAQNGAYANSAPNLGTVGWEEPVGLKHYTWTFPTIAGDNWQTAMAGCTGSGYNNRRITAIGTIENEAACP